jgi:asparagine synthetase B (glutamine-hydrolysing)
MWLISNMAFDKEALAAVRFQSEGNYAFVTDQMGLTQGKEGVRWFHEGFIFPRESTGARFSNVAHARLPRALHEVFGEDFIKHIKGNFALIQLGPNGFRVFSDHFGIRKFFWWKDGGQFAVSNDLKQIARLVRLKPSAVGMATYALTYHFTGGLTAFENVRHNQPAECVSVKNGILKSEKYWHPEDLLDIDRKQISIKEISESLKNATLSTLYSSDPISLSLTGGADTRNLLSIFLSMGVSPHLYTYGNPRSNDCMKTAAIAEGLGLEHQIHDIRMTAENFEDMARKIVRHGGGLASIHRGHRVMAVERESRHAKQMYLGTLGGEFIKGVSEDDYIVPAIVYENWNKTLSRTDDLEKYLDIKRIVADTDLKENLVSYVGTEPFLKGSDVHRKHQALSLITAHLHDAQDVNLYGIAMDRVYTPFLDIDYLETLFASEYTFNNKETIQNPVLRRIQNPVYGSRFIQTTYPPLLKFRYSGEHKPSEVCFNKYMAALLKGLRQKIKGTYPPNFPLGTWMAAFVRKNLPLCKDYATMVLSIILCKFFYLPFF